MIIIKPLKICYMLHFPITIVYQDLQYTSCTSFTFQNTLRAPLSTYITTSSQAVQHTTCSSLILTRYTRTHITLHVVSTIIIHFTRPYKTLHTTSSILLMAPLYTKHFVIHSNRSQKAPQYSTCYFISTFPI